MTPMLRELDDAELCLVGVENPTLWNLVEDMVKRVFNMEGHDLHLLPDHKRTRLGRLFSALPSELQLELVHHVDVRDLTSLSLTCKFYYRECTIVFERFMNRSFAAMGLNWGSIRFMARHLGTILTGWVVHQLLFLESKSFDIDDFDCLEVRVNHAELVLKYFEAATDYMLDTEQSGVKVLRRPNTDSKFHIKLYASNDAPERSVFHKSLTASFSWLGGNGFVVPYAELSFKSRTMALPFPAAEIGMAAERGLEIVPFHADPILGCKDVITCPAMIRNTRDLHCFSEPFLSPAWSYRRVQFCRKVEIAWCLGAQGCAEGTDARSFVTASVNIASTGIDIRQQMMMANLEDRLGVKAGNHLY
ncbi:hypothetical protein R3P38DRAFT_3211592 [Favolaschia claudopus]|uniref:F-box domain-containing protein n=1 Tax=Favolaschia claudopus TaxID=2862362 RepID=A0AAW0AFZ9_9AGAR